MQHLRLVEQLGRGRHAIVTAASIAFFSACTLLIASGCDDARPIEGNGTSVVLIIVDTLRADRMSLYGHSRPTTPQLAGWARRGVVFERAFATSPWTLPSFASIYTGRLPSSHGAGAIVPEADGDAPAPGSMILHGKRIRFTGLDEDATTLAEIFRQAGYSTGAVVNNPFLNAAFGVARGFERYDYEAGSDGETRRADVMVDRALAWIDERREAPFFLVVHLFDPHMNYDPPAETRGRFTSALGARIELPVGNTPRLREQARKVPPRARRFIAAAYDEEIAFVDEQTARFLRDLEKRGLTGRTLVVFTSDHGEELFDHESFGHGHTQYQEQLHVPLIALGAGVVPARVDMPVSIADVAPTVLEAAGLATGVSVDGSMRGRSLWPAITGFDGLEARPIFAERTGAGSERSAVIDWPYKLIRDMETGSSRLFDLEADPGERDDLGPGQPQRRVALEAQIRLVLPEEAGAMPPAGVELDGATREKLRALGYVE